MVGVAVLRAVVDGLDTGPTVLVVGGGSTPQLIAVSTLFRRPGDLDGGLLLTVAGQNPGCSDGGLFLAAASTDTIHITVTECGNLLREDFFAGITYLGTGSVFRAGCFLGSFPCGQIVQL